MKVWELMAALSKCRADAEICVGVAEHYNVPAESAEYEDDGDDFWVTIHSADIPEPL